MPGESVRTAAARDMTTCRHPDRDVPKLMCGYPLPCPWHTVIIHAEREPVTVEIPIDSDALKSPARERIGSIARAVTPLPKSKPTAKRRKKRR